MWHVLGGVTVLAWATVMVAMFYLPDRFGAALPLALHDTAGLELDAQAWFGTYLDDAKLGFVHEEMRRLVDGFSIRQHSRMSLSVAGRRQQVNVRLKLVLNPDFTLRRFESGAEIGPFELRVDGQMQAAGLALNLSIAGQASRRLLTLSRPPVFDVALPHLLAAQDLQPGRRFKLEVFDPQSLENRPSLIEVIGPDAVAFEGRLIPVVHVRQQAAGLEVDSWIGQDGRLYKQQTGNRLLVLRETEERAKQGVDPAHPGRIDANWMESLGRMGGGRD